MLLCFSGQDDDLSSPRRGAIGKSSKVVQPSAASNVPLVPLRSKTLSRNYRNSFLVDDFNTRHLSLGNTLNSVKIPDQYKTLPATSNQSAFDIYMNLPPKSSFSDSSSKTADEKDSDHVQLSVQHGNTNLHTSLMPLSSKPPEVVVSDDSKEESIQQSSEKRSRSTTPLPPTPLYDVVSNGLKESTVQKSSEKLDRSLIPLPHTPLEVAVSNNSSIQQNSERRSRSPSPLPPIPSDTVVSNGLKEESKRSSEKLDRSLIPLPHTPLEVAVSNNSSIQQNSERCSRPPSPLPPTPSDTIVSNGLKEESKRSSEKLDRSLIPLPHTPLEIAVSNNSSIQQNSERRSRSPSPLPPIPSDTIVSNGLKGESKRSSEKLDRSLIPLPHTPLEVAVSYNSSIQQNSERRSRPPSPLPPTPSDTIVSNGLKEEIVQKSFKKLDRSEMPLPLTPLEVVVLNNSGEVNMQQSSEKCNRSTMPLPPTPLDAVIFSDLMESSAPATLSTGPEGGTTDEKNTRGMNKSFTDDAQMEEYSSSSDGYERINFDELEKAPTPLPFTADGISTTTDNVTVTNSLGENCTTTVNKEFDRIMQADGSQVNSSLTDTSTLEVVSAVNETSLCMADTRADNDNGTAACLDEDYVISDYEFYSMHKQMQTPLTDSTDQVSSSTPEYLELQGLNPALDDYVPMHKADSQDLKRPSQVHVYDYACHSYMYVEMCRYKLQQSGVPPRRVKREGHTPSVSISSTSTGKNATYVNMKRQHNVTLLPPRSSGADNPNSLSEDHSEPMMPPRNALRIGYYLSAPSAVPK